MATLATMRQRIADELHRDDLTTEIDRQINSAIRYYDTQRFKFNEKKDVLIGTTVISQLYYTLSASFIEFDTLKLAYNGTWIPLKFRPWQWIDENDSQIVPIIGTPAYYSTYGEEDQLRIFPSANQANQSLVAAYQYRLGLSFSGSTSNGWTNEAELLIRHRSKAAVEIFRLQKIPAKQEQLLMLQRPQTSSFLSMAEMQAHKELRKEYNKYAATGQITAHEVL